MPSSDPSDPSDPSPVSDEGLKAPSVVTDTKGEAVPSEILKDVPTTGTPDKDESTKEQVDKLSEELKLLKDSKKLNERKMKVFAEELHRYKDEIHELEGVGRTRRQKIKSGLKKNTYKL
jgi:hypothetical protein